MEQIWAPWRMDYILADRRPGCFLCDLIPDSADRDHLVLQRRPHTLILMNRYPYSNGHCMVAPYRHVADIEPLTDTESLDLMAAVRLTTRLLKTQLNADGFNIGINLGKVAGAGLETHLHIHIVPRWQGDHNFMAVTAETSVIPQSLTALYDQLKPLFDAVPPCLSAS